MPELAEVRGFAAVVNSVGDHVFLSCEKSEVHRGEPIHVPYARWGVRAVARGKEMMLIITSLVDGGKQMFVRFGFGMTGSMQYFPVGTDVNKHAHFLLKDTLGGTLAFVDQRRFGTWLPAVNAQDWGANRGPCPLTEFDEFARNVATGIRETKWWNKPICETLLDQGFFNGIGNYLRAEILHEAGITDPFRKTSLVFADLTVDNCTDNKILRLCRDIAARFDGVGYDEFEATTNVYGAKNALKRKDSNGRMVWWIGKRAKEDDVDDGDDGDEDDDRPKKSKKNLSKSGSSLNDDGADDRPKKSKKKVSRSISSPTNDSGDDADDDRPKKSKRILRSASGGHKKTMAARAKSDIVESRTHQRRTTSSSLRKVKSDPRRRKSKG